MQALWKHQELAVARAKQGPDLALLFSMGTGKTRTTIEILRDTYNEARCIKPTLIFGPLIVTKQWKNEFAKFSKVPQEKIVVLTGPKEKRLKAFTHALEKFEGNFIATVNYEGLLIKDLYVLFTMWRPKIIVMDESQRLKDNSTKRFKAIMPLCDRAERRFILTGTPVLNSALDLYAQYRLLDRGETFGTNFYAFRAKYFYDKNAGMPKHKYFPNWVFRNETTAIFQEKLAATSVQARKEECLDLPPRVEVPVEIELGKDQKRAYDEMKKQFVTWVKSGAVTAQLAITQSIRLRQILSGFAQPEHKDGEQPPVTEFEDNPRLDACADIVEDAVEQGHKVIIWTNYAHCYKMLGRKFEKLTPVFITGEQSESEKNKNIESFCRGPIHLAICNPAAAGLGVNLTESDVSIRFDRSFNLEHYLQSRDRNYRGGSEMHEKVTQYELIAKGTLDEAIHDALNGKQDMAAALLAWANKDA